MTNHDNDQPEALLYPRARLRGETRADFIAFLAAHLREHGFVTGAAAAEAEARALAEEMGGAAW